MINPGGTPSTSFTKTAMSRHNNNQVSAAQATMPHNLAAQQSLRKQYSKKNPTNQTLGPQAQSMSPVPIQQQAPQASVPQAQPEFNPELLAPDPMDQLVGDIRTKQFLESPRVKDAVEAIRFKNVMNRDNPKSSVDTRSLFQQVISRMGMGNDL